jgi:hypothetical protein
MKSRCIIAAATAAFGPAAPVWACATCFGAADDPQTHGMNAAILTLLSVTYGLFFTMGAAGFVLWRRARLATDPPAVPPAGGVPSDSETPRG